MSLSVIVSNRKPSAVLCGCREQRSGDCLRSWSELRHGQQGRHLHCGHQKCRRRCHTFLSCGQNLLLSFGSTEKAEKLESENVVSFFSGGLSLAVEGPSKAEITCKDNKDGTCTVSYLPTAPGDYNIIVKFDNKHIPGSPFTAKITGENVFSPID